LTTLYNINFFWQLGIAYVAGHIVQAIVSVVWKDKYDVDLKNNNISQEVISKFKKEVANIIGTEKITHYDFLIVENNISDDKISTKINMFRAFQ
jgi:hypothetical protein